MNLGHEGLEPPHGSSGEVATRLHSGAHSGARSGTGVILVDDDAGWAAIVEAWPKLSADAQRVIVEFVDRELGVVDGVRIERRDRGD